MWQSLIYTGAPLQEPVAMGANIIMNSQQDRCISDELLPEKGCHLGFFDSDLKFSYKPQFGGSGCKTWFLKWHGFIAGIGRSKWWFESRLFWSQLGAYRRWHWVDEARARVKSVGNWGGLWYKSAKWGIPLPHHCFSWMHLKPQKQIKVKRCAVVVFFFEFFWFLLFVSVLSH